MTAHQWHAIGVVSLALAAILGGCGKKEEEKKVYTNTVVVASSPESGASVLIDGQAYGETPVTVKGLEPGPTLVEVKREGYRDAYDTITVPPSGEVTFTLEMEPLVGRVTILSEPDQAEVYLGGATFLGITPLVQVSVPSGQRELTLKKEGYEPLTVQLKVEVDYQYTKSYALKPRRGRVEVYSSPTGATVWINNQLQLERTPMRVDLTPGTYTISVYQRGYVMAEEVIELAPAQQRQVDLKMKEGAAPPGMVLIPAGEFLFGEDSQSPDERPRRQVFVEAFYIDKYEVTNVQFKAVFAAHTYEEGFDNWPVTNVTWEQATAYATATGKRLPSEIEWEKAARGADGREYPWGELFNSSLANTGGDANAKIMEVGQFRGGASPYGCLDMAGNAYEWTSSWYKAYPGNPEVKKDYGQVYRVLRGGSYQTRSYDVRCAKRHYARMDATRQDYGFRCAADIKEEGKVPTAPAQ